MMVRVGARLCVASYREPALPADAMLILIRPSPAFGDGHHATTQMCLEMLEQEIRGGERILDVGTGSGILAIAAAKLGARTVLGAEIHGPSCEAALANIRLNGVERAVHVFQGSVDAIHPGQMFDLAVANLYNAQQVMEVLPELTRRIRPGGMMICGGIWVGRREEMQRLLSAEHFTPRKELARHQIVTIAYVKGA